MAVAAPALAEAVRAGAASQKCNPVLRVVAQTEDQFEKTGSPFFRPARGRLLRDRSCRDLMISTHRNLASAPI
jgi:hypothetical protein